MIKKIWLLISSFVLIVFLFGCSSDVEPIPDLPNKGFYEVNRVDEIDFENPDYQEVTIDNPNLLCNTYMDVEPDFVLTLELTSAYLSAEELEEDIEAKTTTGNPIELEFLYKNTNNKTLIEVSAKNGYKPGAAYTISIENNNSLIFSGRSEEVRKVIFTIKDDDSDTLDLNKNYPTYELSKVSHFVGYAEDAYLLYDGSISANPNDIIIFADSSESVFIKVKKIESSNGMKKIYYECPEVGEIFNDVDLHVNQRAADMENDFVLNDITDIANEVANSDHVLMYCYAIADEYDFVPQLGSFLDTCSINFSFKPDGKKFTLALELSYVYTTQAGWRICGSLKFKWVKSFVVSADVSVETFLGIPVDISMNSAVGCDDSFEFQPSITKKNKAFDPGNTDDEPKELNLEKARKAVEKYKERWSELDKSGYKKDVVVGDTVMINLGRLSFYLGYVTIDIDVYACLKLTTDVTLGVSYIYNYHTVLIDYGTDDGVSDAGMSPSSVGVHTISASIAGKMSIEAYLKLRVTLHITGLRSVANISVDGDAGVYLDLTGLGTAGYDFNAGSFDGNLGASLEFGFLFRVSLSVNLFWFIHLNWDLFVAKLPIFKLGASFDIKDRVSSDTVELNKLVTDISEAPILTFTVFDADGLSLITKTFGYKDSIKYYESILSKDASYDIFSDFSTNTDKAKFGNGKIVIADGTPELDFVLSFKVKKSPFTSPETVNVNCHYKSRDAKYVTFDGENQQAYLPGQTVYFPTSGEARSGYLFKGYEYNGKIYNDRTTFVMGTENVNFKAIYVLDETYTVRFYDGFNNLVYTTTVKNYDDVVAPDPSIRDINMEGYNFICYDKSLKEIKGDLDIYAFYERSSEQ